MLADEEIRTLAEAVAEYGHAVEMIGGRAGTKLAAALPIARRVLETAEPLTRLAPKQKAAILVAETGRAVCADPMAWLVDALALEDDHA